MGITINEGTLTEVYAKNCSGTEVQIVKLDVGSGTALSDWGGSVSSTLNTLISGEDQTNDVLKTEQQFSYAYSAAVGTTVVKAAAGFLHGILLGSNSAGGALIVYDNATGTSGDIMGLIKASAVENFYPFNCKATSGIVVANIGTQIYTAIYR